MEIFAQKYGAYAKAAAAGTSIYPTTILTAAALESGYGGSELARLHNNFFGVKAGKSWKGATVKMPTKEQKNNGQVYWVTATFRAYPTPEGSFKNYVELVTNKHYTSKGVSAAAGPLEQFAKLQQAGYATDVKYAAKLSSLFNSVKDWAVANPVKATAAAAGTGLLLVGLFFAYKLFK